MKTAFLLIMLSQNAAGDINAAFVNTETLEQCQQKGQMLKEVFKASKIPVLEEQCIQSTLQFSAYEHTANASKPRHFYLLVFDGGEVEVDDRADWRECRQRAQASVSRDLRVYCTSSVQFQGY